MNKDEMRALLKEHYTEIGKRGGKKTSSRGVEYYREIQKRSVIKRHLNKAKKMLEADLQGSK
jgi:general stress protein YciG